MCAAEVSAHCELTLIARFRGSHLERILELAQAAAAADWRKSAGSSVEMDVEILLKAVDCMVEAVITPVLLTPLAHFG